jgi:hypothetical protein
MIKRTVDRTELDSVETLNLEPAFCHEYNSKEYLRIAVLPEDAKGEDGTLSLQIIHFDKDWKVNCAQACLLISEIDLVINGLLEAKKRMQAL